MDTSRPVFKQLDHVVARVDDPHALFSVLTEALSLPAAWPLKSYPSFQSGGVTLGNLYLEIMQCGPRREARGAGRFCAIAFESPAIEEAVRELSERGIPHTPVAPYAERGADGEKIKIWANVVLGRLLGRDFLLDTTIALSRLPGAARLSDAGSGSALDRWQIGKLFERSLVFLCEFYYENFGDRPFWSEFKDHDAKRAHDLGRLRAGGGGALGVERVTEVVAGVKDFGAARELWRTLYAPAPEKAAGVWEVDDGPAVRLVPAASNSIQTLTLKVSSLERAAVSLRESGMLGAVTDNEIAIAPARLEGLDVRLVA
jgi:hypothetical protein